MIIPVITGATLTVKKWFKEKFGSQTRKIFNIFTTKKTAIL